jgi:hypothetical protein
VRTKMFTYCEVVKPNSSFVFFSQLLTMKLTFKQA